MPIWPLAELEFMCMPSPTGNRGSYCHMNEALRSDLCTKLCLGWLASRSLPLFLLFSILVGLWNHAVFPAFRVMLCLGLRADQCLAALALSSPMLVRNANTKQPTANSEPGAGANVHVSSLRAFVTIIRASAGKHAQALSLQHIHSVL